MHTPEFRVPTARQQPAALEQDAGRASWAPDSPGTTKVPSLMEELAEKFGCQSLDEAGPAAVGEAGPPRRTEPADPLRWFGGLVPVQLRRSKSSFDRALEHMVRAAHLGAKLQGMSAATVGGRAPAAAAGPQPATARARVHAAA